MSERKHMWGFGERKYYTDSGAIHKLFTTKQKAIDHARASGYGTQCEQCLTGTAGDEFMMYNDDKGMLCEIAKLEVVA